ncbi:MAG: hypothetical protein QNJ58_19755, partial [Desulfobacterales bacterium]|nr:hypothetical protein [Desulfobacterales bacterium]
MGIREGEFSRGGVFDGIVADSPLAVTIGPVGSAVTVVVQTVTAKRYHIGQIAAVKGVGDGDVIGRGAVHTAT